MHPGVCGLPIRTSRAAAVRLVREGQGATGGSARERVDEKAEVRAAAEAFRAIVNDVPECWTCRRKDTLHRPLRDVRY
jgi:hypothetical protein